MHSQTGKQANNNIMYIKLYTVNQIINVYA